MSRRLALAAMLAACGASHNSVTSDAPTTDNDAPLPADGPVNCAAVVTYDPAAPIAGPNSMVRAIANVVGALGQPSYTWTVTLANDPVSFTSALPDGSQIEFTATDPGTYVTTLTVQSPGPSCISEPSPLNVTAPGANIATFRLHVTPPESANAPPLDRTFPVSGGGPFDMDQVVLDPGFPMNVSLKTASNAPVPGYVRIADTGNPDAIVEAFAGSSGSFTALVSSDHQDVMVVPAIPGLAPRLFTGQTPTVSSLVLDAGTAISGVVRDPSNAPLANATVQLAIGSVPSTLTTTAADGSFTVLAVPVAGAVVSVEISPPAASGLPGLVATSQTFDLAQSVQIRYSASLASRNVGATVVKRGSSAVAAAVVQLVGTIASAGTVSAGTTATAQGNVVVALTANGSGALPAQLVPATSLSAVVTVAPGDLAVAAFDLTSGVPATISAPAMDAVATSVTDPHAVALAGIAVELVPVGALALAGVPAIHAVSTAGGAVTTSVAHGGRYDLRFHDPAGRGAPVIAANQSAGSIAASYALVPAINVSGTLKVAGNPTPIDRASVQILCDVCTGIERARPIAEMVTDVTGKFTLAVPDPGTM